MSGSIYTNCLTSTKKKTKREGETPRKPRRTGIQKLQKQQNLKQTKQEIRGRAEGNKRSSF